MTTEPIRDRTRLLVWLSYAALTVPPVVFVALAWHRFGTGGGLVMLVAWTLIYALLLFVPVEERRFARTPTPAPVLAEPPGAALLSGAQAEQRYGANGVEVARFLARLPSLGAEHWDLLRRQHRRMDAFLQMWREERANHRALNALQELEMSSPRAEAIMAALGEMRRYAETGTVPELQATYLDARLREAGVRNIAAPLVSYAYSDLSAAVIALVYLDLLQPEDFATLYGRVEAIIPAASLRPQE